MRTLRFVVDQQIIMQDPGCDFSSLVPGTAGYLQAEFLFSPEWDGCAKVASFRSSMGKEYKPQVLKDGKTCMIPAEALMKKAFKLSIVGKKNTDESKYTIRTNEIEVVQDGGKV